MSTYTFRPSQKTIPHCGMRKTDRMALGLRQVPDIGLWALDSGMGTCVWRTEACADCYNRKTIVYPGMKACWSPGGLDDRRWALATPKSFSGLYRVRLNTRGDSFPNIREVDRVASWVAGNPDTKFWIVTRAWQIGMHGSPKNWYRLNSGMMKAIEDRVMIYKNAYVQASIDDWTGHHWETLRDRGWNTMHFSRAGNAIPALGKDGSNVVKCRKTWDLLPHPTRAGRHIHRKSVCRTCRNGCFSEKRVDVWLKWHW